MTVKTIYDGTKWTKANYYKGGDLKGTWTITLKIDGIRCIRDNEGYVFSRNSKPIKHLDNLVFNDAEFYYKDWNTSFKILASEEVTIPVTQDMVYNLDPVDKRLLVGTCYNPTEAMLLDLLRKYRELGYEGLVLRQNNKWLKVVPTLYRDVRILDVKEGNGKYANMCGSLTTTIGTVGSFELQEDSDDVAFRKELLNNKDKYIGKIAQVAYRELTSKGTFRFPRLTRIRLDKDYEDK